MSANDVKRQLDVRDDGETKARSLDTTVGAEVAGELHFELARRPGGSSKFAGVTLHKLTRRWNSEDLGLFESEELAAEARQKNLREKLEPPNQSTPEKTVCLGGSPKF